MKISKILAGMSAAAIVASMAMIPASAAGTKLNVSDDLLAIGRQTQDDLFAIFFRGDDSEGNVVKDGITDITAVYGASFTIKVDNNDWNTIGGGGSINFNDTKNGWNAKEWAGGSWVDDEKPKDTLCYTTDEEGTYVLEYKSETPLFDAVDDEEKGYAAVGINNWAADLGVKVLGADGNAIYEAGSNKDKKEVQKKPVAEESSSKTDSTASGTDSKTDSKKDDSKTSSAAATSTAATSSKAGTTSTAATSSAAASDKTAATGATAGLALAGVALAGAAIVISKRK